MRMSIVLDDKLLAEAQALSNITTKRKLIEEALKEFIASRKRLDILKLKGSNDLRVGYDHKSTRGRK